MKKIFYVMFLLIVLSNCAKSYLTNVKQIIDMREKIDKSIVEVRGYIYVEDIYSIKLYSDKNSNEFIDIVINENTKFDKQLKENKFYCVDISGQFQFYDRDIIVKMNLSSEFGLIIVNELSRCR